MPAREGLGAETVGITGSPAGEVLPAARRPVLDVSADPYPAEPSYDGGLVDATHVTAVLVAHDGARWLPEVLTALAAQTRLPDWIVTVDTGSTDASARLLADAFGSIAVVPAERSTGYGAAVAQGLVAAGGLAPSGFVWLLHDDAAPAPDALERLLAYADTDPSAAVIGPAVTAWDDPGRLVEVGVTLDGAGRRRTGTGDRPEAGQGAHDVLAVGTACALVRTAAWEALGGLDPQLPAFRDDIDLGMRAGLADLRVVVVPAATVRHARAALTGIRRPEAAGRSPRRADRRAALYCRLANARLAALPYLLLRLPVATALRSAGLLLRGRPRAATDDLVAALVVLATPHRLWRGRAFRRGARRLPARALRPLLIRRRDRLRTAGERWAGRLGRASELTGPLVLVRPAPAKPAGRRVRPLRGALAGLGSRAGAPLTVVLLATGLVAARALLGGGDPTGGRLTDLPAGAHDLWSAYAAAWHPAGLGSGGPVPVWTLPFAVLATLTAGKPWLAADVLLLGGPALTGLAAYAAARRLRLPRPLRAAAALAYAVLPAATGAYATGRIDVVLALAALPYLLAGGARLAAGAGLSGLSRVARVAVGLATVAACAPALYPPLALLLVLAPLAARRPARLPYAVVAAAAPIALLWPAARQAVAHPALLTGGWGATLLPVPPAPGPAALLLLSPGGTGVPVIWITGPLLLAGLAGLLRADVRARRTALAGWGVALTGLVAALAASRVHVDGGRAWPGPALALAGAGVLVAACAAAAGAGERLRLRSFGWRQLSAALLAVAAVLAPVALAGSYADRRGGTLVARERGTPLAVYATGGLLPGERVLVLRPGPTVRYDLVSAAGPVLGSEDLAVGRPTSSTDAPSSGDAASFTAAAVRALVTGRGAQVSRLLATADITDVVMPAPAGTLVGPAATLAAALDADPSLVPADDGGPLRRWRVPATGATVAVLAAPTARTARLPLDLTPGPASTTGTPLAVRGALGVADRPATATLRPGAAGRLLVLAAATDPRWRVTLDGVPLPARTAWSWAQAFELPRTGGRLVIAYDGSQRARDIDVQAASLGLLVLLAVPLPRPRSRRSGDAGAVKVAP